MSIWKVHVNGPFSDNSNKITLDRRTDKDRKTQISQTYRWKEKCHAEYQFKKI